MCIRDRIQRALSEVADDIDEIRQKTIDALKEKDLTEIEYRDLVKGLDTLTKNHQLLSGGATSRTETFEMHDLSDEELQEIALKKMKTLDVIEVE